MEQVTDDVGNSVEIHSDVCVCRDCGLSCPSCGTTHSFWSFETGAPVVCVCGRELIAILSGDAPRYARELGIEIVDAGLAYYEETTRARVERLLVVRAIQGDQPTYRCPYCAQAHYRHDWQCRQQEALH